MSRSWDCTAWPSARRIALAAAGLVWMAGAAAAAEPSGRPGEELGVDAEAISAEVEAALEAELEAAEAAREARQSARDALRSARHELRRALGKHADCDSSGCEDAELEGDDRKDARQQFQKAYREHRRGRYEKAVEGWLEAFRLGYRKGTTAYNLACAYARLRDTEHALEWLNQALDQGFNMDDYLETDQDLVSLRSDPRFRALRDQYGDQGVRRNALNRLERLEKADSRNGEAWYDVGMDLHRLGEYDRAIDAWRRAVAEDRSPAAATYNIACAYARKGDVRAALDSLEQALELGYGSADYYDEDEDLDLLRKEPRFREIRESARALELPDGDWLGAGHGWSRRVDWDAAAARYESYLKTHPQSGNAWFKLGFASLRRGQAKRAAEEFQKAYNLGFRKPTSAYNIACSYAVANEKDRAFEWLDRARELGFEQDWSLATDPDLDNLRDDPRFPELGPRSWMRRLYRHFGHD